jgi:hydroxymethylpyrimidine pyrophosphatase-like HAD family hydrolase
MIGEDRIVKPELIDAISRVQSLGAVVSISTGRTLTPALKISEEAGATGPVICFQGAMTYDQVSKTALRHVRLSEAITTRAIMGLVKTVPEVMMFLGNDVWVEKRSKWTDGYGQRMGVAIRDTDSLMSMADQLPTAIVGVGDPQVVGPLVERLHEQLNGSALVTHSLPMFCEIEAIDAGKDHAVEHLAGTLNIERAGVIEWAGLGVGVEGGHPDLLSAADRMIVTPDNSGLVSFLEELADAGKFGPPIAN